MKHFLQSCFTVCALLIANNLLASIIYVDITATGTNTGESWANAYTIVRTAINNAVADDEIYIAAGTYTEGNTITITKNVSLIGGFPNGGGSQNIEFYKTILDGENSYQVLSNLSETTLHGLVIQNGNAANACWNININKYYY